MFAMWFEGVHPGREQISEQIRQQFFIHIVFVIMFISFLLLLVLCCSYCYVYSVFVFMFPSFSRVYPPKKGSIRLRDGCCDFDEKWQVRQTIKGE